VDGGDEVEGRPEVEEVGGADGADVGFFVGGIDGYDGRAEDGGVLGRKWVDEHGRRGGEVKSLGMVYIP